MIVRGEVQTAMLKTTRARRVPLLALFASNTISLPGNVLAIIAVPWFVLQTTGSVIKTGITAFFTTVPLVIAATLGSGLVDRLGYKRTSVVCDIASGTCIALIPLLYQTGRLAFWQLLVLVFLSALFNTPGRTARLALTSDLATLAEMHLERANSISEGINRASNLIGGSLAGILIALIGSSNLLWVDAATFAVSALLIGTLVPSASSPAKTTPEDSYLSNIMAGIRFIYHNQLVLSLTLTVMMTNMLDEALTSVMLPDYAKNIFGSAVPFGLMVGAFGGAAFLGAILFGVVGNRLPRRMTFAVGYLIGGGTRFLALALVPILPVLIVVYIIAGVASGSLNPIITTLLQERATPEMRARVFGAVLAGVVAAMPLGVILSGYLVDRVGITTSLLLSGICYVVITLSLLVNPALTMMEKVPGGRGSA